MRAPIHFGTGCEASALQSPVNADDGCRHRMNDLGNPFKHQAAI